MAPVVCGAVVSCLVTEWEVVYSALFHLQICYHATLTQ